MPLVQNVISKVPLAQASMSKPQVTEGSQIEKGTTTTYYPDQVVVQQGKTDVIKAPTTPRCPPLTESYLLEVEATVKKMTMAELELSQKALLSQGPGQCKAEFAVKLSAIQREIGYREGASDATELFPEEDTQIVVEPPVEAVSPPTTLQSLLTPKNMLIAGGVIAGLYLLTRKEE